MSNMADHQNGNVRETHVSALLNCIDLSNPDIHQTAALIKQACMDSGFFYLINHGISEEFMSEVFAQSKKFFALPIDEKMKLIYRKKRGYRINRLMDQETKIQARGEAFQMIQEADQDAYHPLRGPNLWPPADLCPGFKETLLRYHQELLNVAKAVARIIAIALDLNADFFDQPQLLGDALSFIVFHHYEDSEPSEEYKLGTPAHGDGFLITLLATEYPGLQICKNIDANPRVWENVDPLKGALIVNIGDMLERISNCVFKSTKHRVWYRYDRYSAAFNILPSYECTVECLPTCKSAENPPKYPPVECKKVLNMLMPDVLDEHEVTDLTKIQG